METKTNNLNYTNAGKEAGYTEEEIIEAVERIDWEPFRTSNLPFSQGECLKTVIKECKIPLSKITRLSLHGVIKSSHGFYGLDVNYANGRALIFIADNGCSACPVAVDFTPNK